MLVMTVHADERVGRAPPGQPVQQHPALLPRVRGSRRRTVVAVLVHARRRIVLAMAVAAAKQPKARQPRRHLGGARDLRELLEELAVRPAPESALREDQQLQAELGQQLRHRRVRPHRWKVRPLWPPRRRVGVGAVGAALDDDGHAPPPQYAHQADGEEHQLVAHLQPAQLCLGERAVGDAVRPATRRVPRAQHVFVGAVGAERDGERVARQADERAAVELAEVSARAQRLLHVRAEHVDAALDVHILRVRGARGVPAHVGEVAGEAGEEVKHREPRQDALRGAPRARRDETFDREGFSSPLARHGPSVDQSGAVILAFALLPSGTCFLVILAFALLPSGTCFLDTRFRAHF